MKLPSSEKQWLREIEKVIDNVYRKMENCDRIDKEQFQSILDYVIGRVSKNRGIARIKVAEKTGEVIETLAVYLKNTPEDERNWAGTVAFLYVKFHQVLGLADEQKLLSVLHASVSSDRIPKFTLES